MTDKPTAATLTGLGKKPESSGGPSAESTTKEETTVAEVAAETPVVRWSTHPILKFKVGKFRFENGLLTLADGEEIREFQAAYDGLPIYERSRIKKIDLSAAEALVRERLATGGGATKGIDSSTGDRAPNKQVGTGDLLKGQ